MPLKKLLTILLVVSATIIFITISKQKVLAADSAFVVSDDNSKGHVTLENNNLKLVFYYKTTAENHFNKSGGNMYELYNKVTSPIINLVPLYDGGSDGTGAYAMGVSGIGSTQMYALPNASDQHPTDQQASSYLPTVSDNDLDGTYVSHAVSTIASGNSKIEFVFRVGSHHRIDPNADIEWYELKKTWEIEPTGKIHLTQEWKLLRSGWIVEPATRSQFSWDVGWTTLSKYGHDWATPECDSGTSGNGNSPACLSKSYTKNIAIAGVAAKCWALEDRFHPQTVKLTGSATAPDITIQPDNNGNGFEGLGLWQLNRLATNQTEGDSIFEECSFDRRDIGDGTAGFALGFFSWWGGDPNPGSPNTDRYRYIDIAARPELQSWKDSYTISLDSTGKTPAPTPLPTTLSVNLLLHGLGKGGDSANTNGGGTANPIHTSRQIKVEILNSRNQLILTKEGTVNFDQSAGSFKGSIDVGSLQSGTYTVKIKSDKFLKALVPGIQIITQGAANNLSPTRLVSGDADNNNAINVLDYSLILDCYSDITPAKDCSDPAKKASTDITDDGAVNQFDYNLFLRELNNAKGE